MVAHLCYSMETGMIKGEVGLCDMWWCVRPMAMDWLYGAI